MADYILDEGEKVIEKIYRYWADLVPIFVSAGLIILFVLVGLFAYGLHPEFVPSFITADMILTLAGILLGVVVLMIISAYYVYIHNYLVVTNRHLIKVQQAGLFARQTAELGLGNIEDVRGGRRGVFGTILDFGDVEIQTAGASENFQLRTMAHPQLLADRLLQYKEEFRRRHGEHA